MEIKQSYNIQKQARYKKMAKGRAIGSKKRFMVWSEHNQTNKLHAAKPNANYLGLLIFD